MNQNKKTFNDTNLITGGVDEATAIYWNSPITRKEIQNEFDDFAKVILEMKAQITKVDFAVSYVLEKFNVQASDIESWMKKKMEEFNAKQEKAN